MALPSAHPPHTPTLLPIAEVLLFVDVGVWTLALLNLAQALMR